MKDGKCGISVPTSQSIENHLNSDLCDFSRFLLFRSPFFSLFSSFHLSSFSLLSPFRLPLFFLLSTLLILTIGCGRKKETIPLSSGQIGTPYQELGSTTLFFYEGKYKRWRLDADYMKKPLLDTGLMLVTPVKLTLFDSLGHQQTKVLADSGTTTAGQQSFTIWGNVYIRSHDSLIVRTSKLWWIKGQSKVESDTFVQIETLKGDILRGKGLDADEDFHHFSFKSQVSGQFPDFKRRVSSDEQFLGGDENNKSDKVDNNKSDKVQKVTK